eukprot:jgi/Galph1/1420/GphlegSOOS_G110.1
MGRMKRTRKFAQVQRRLNPNDQRLQIKQWSKQDAAPILNQRKDQEKLQELPVPTSLFFSYNTALGPPFHVLMDTNFINFSVVNKLDILKAMMDCLFAPCVACVTDCVMAELEKLGSKYRLALKVARDKRFVRLKCFHQGTYADDCLVERVQENRVYIVGTCDKDLKRRLRKVPGVPIMYIKQHRYTIERLPDAFMAPKI